MQRNSWWKYRWSLNCYDCSKISNNKIALRFVELLCQLPDPDSEKSFSEWRHGVMPLKGILCPVVNMSESDILFISWSFWLHVLLLKVCLKQSCSCLYFYVGRKHFIFRLHKGWCCSRQLGKTVTVEVKMVIIHFLFKKLIFFEAVILELFWRYGGEAFVAVSAIHCGRLILQWPSF